tara:strand:- start:549 stop:1169 length:621 start_codon:yes stop_codon:yes gene_type:complete
MIEKINGFWVPSNDMYIEDWKAGKAFTQNKCLLKFIDYCKNKNIRFETVLDVGAWCGTWCHAMLPFSTRVIAFEPDPIHFECLQKNVACEAKMQAVGSKSDKISLTNDNFTQAKRVDTQGSIDMITLDSLQLSHVDLLKIDVEGYEMEVLQGAKDTMPQTKYLMIELNNNSKKYGSNNLEIEKYIKTLGFKILMEHWPDKVYYNAN